MLFRYITNGQQTILAKKPPKTKKTKEKEKKVDFFKKKTKEGLLDWSLVS